MGDLIKLKRNGKRIRFKRSKPSSFKPLKTAKGLITVGLGLALFGAARRML